MKYVGDINWKKIEEYKFSIEDVIFMEAPRN